MLNGDEAGRAAATKHGTTLHALLPDMPLTTVAVPDGEDVNSLLQTHDDPRVLAELIGQRTVFSFSIEPSPTEPTPAGQPKASSSAAATPASGKLITANLEQIIYDNCELLITVLGGIKLMGLDRMKVTLKVEHKAKQCLPIRHHLDLYNHPHTEQFINKVAESFDISTQATTQTIAALTGELEAYRARRLEAVQPRAEERVQFNPAQRHAAINYLKQANLLERTGEDIGRSGVVGEETNQLIVYLVYSSRKLAVPLHLMFLGSIGSGKTWLLAFIEAITFYHQYQRSVKRDGQGHPYIESTVAYIEAAFSLLKDVLFSKSDELTKASRGFLELLKVLLKEQAAY